MISLYLFMLDTDEEKSRFTHIYQKYSHNMTNIIYTVLHDDCDVKTALNDALCSIARCINSIPQNDEICERSYVYKIAKNAALKLIKENNKRDRIICYYTENAVDNRSPADELIENEGAKRILEHIYALPESYRDILIMRSLFEMSYKQIASALGINIGAARVRYSRGLALLREKMKGVRN